MDGQARAGHELVIDPVPAVTSTYEDYFGNAVTFFAMQGSHKRLSIRAKTTVLVEPPLPPDPAETVAWEIAADQAQLPLEAVEFVFPAGLLASAELQAYGASCFTSGRPVLEAVVDL